MRVWGGGFAVQGPLNVILKLEIGSDGFLRPKGSFPGVGGFSGPFKNGFVHFDHPYIFNIHGSVLFAGIAGKKKEAVEVGTLVRELQAEPD